jgi:hypothetical protein
MPTEPDVPAEWSLSGTFQAGHTYAASVDIFSPAAGATFCGFRVASPNVV